MNIRPIENVVDNVSSALIKMADGVKTKLFLRGVKAYKIKKKFDNARILDTLNKYPEPASLEGKKKSDRKDPVTPVRTELLEL